MAQCRANREEEEMVLRARLDHLSDEDGQEMMNRLLCDLVRTEAV